MAPPTRNRRRFGAPADRPLLEARGLGYRHHRSATPTFAAVDLQVRRGERIVLAGPSGGGKSTLAATLAGLRVPQDGVLHRGGLDGDRLGDRRARVLMVPQFHENHVLSASLAFNLLLGHRWPPAPADLAEAEQVCRAVGLGPVLEALDPDAALRLLDVLLDRSDALLVIVHR